MLQSEVNESSGNRSGSGVLVQALDLEAYPIVENPKPSSVEAMALVVVPQTQEPLEVSMI